MRLLVLVVVMTVAPVWAQSPEPDNEAQSERPWAKGVSESEQKAALDLFEQGNKLFLREAYLEARTTYEEALSHWDHPSIRFNLSECLVHLDRPLDALDHIQRALRFGAAPLSPEVYKRARTQRKLLEAQLAIIELEVGQDGVRVTVNGKEVLKGTGKRSVRVQPGRHQILAEKKGFIPLSREVVALPAEPAIAKIKLFPVGSNDIVLKRRWTPWVPWTIAATGTALAAAGVVFAIKGNSTLNEFDDKVAERCPSGCTADEAADLGEIQDRGKLQATIGYSLLGVGAAALVSGTVLVILNQPRKVKREIGVTTIVTPTYQGIGLSASF